MKIQKIQAKNVNVMALRKLLLDFFIWHFHFILLKNLLLFFFLCFAQEKNMYIFGMLPEIDNE